jgi:hypothetical protein
MQRFFFDLSENNSSIRDRQGVLLPELGEAELEAAGAIARMLSEEVPMSDDHEVAIVIRDVNNTPVACVSLTLKRRRLN